MSTAPQPKVFISYAHADGESAVKHFWINLHEFLKTPERRWDKWLDKEIMAGEDWDRTITQALEEGCNCCLLLLSDLFAKSSYILNKEWPRTLVRSEEQGIVFFPVVFGVLEGGLAALPENMGRFQVYWPTVADLYNPPPENVSNPDQVRQCYKDVKEKDAARDRFLSRLAAQMNARFDEYLRAQAAKATPPAVANLLANTKHFVTNDSDEETFARAFFGSFSYEKRYRDSNSKGHYFPREIDEKLDERLCRGDWVLVEGHPLAGKTRAVFEAVRRLMFKGRSIALWPFKVPERPDQPLIPPTFPQVDCPIVWMDDIDARFRDLAKQGYGASDINRFLEYIADAGIILASTARTGPAYYDFRHRFGLNDHLWDKLESLPIQLIQGDEEYEFTEWYQTNFGADLPDRFDHHPGSLFLNLEAMGDRWRNMDNILGEHGLRLDAERAKDIMRALHVFYVMESYRAGGLFLEKDIRFYLRHKGEKRRTNTQMGIAFTRAQLLDQLPGGEDWETLIEVLSQDKFHLGFLRREGEYLLTETAYLDYIVAPDGEKNIVQTIVENFSEEERLRLGLIVTSYNFGDVFSKSPPKNEKDLAKLVRKLKPLGLDREIKVWNQLLALCPTLKLARRTMEMVANAGLIPDVSTYSMLVGKAEDYAAARSIIEEMKDAGVSPTAYTYGALIGKAEDYAAARGILEEMKDAGVRPNSFTYGVLVFKSNNYAAARSIIEEMKAAGVRPGLRTYNTLIRKAEDYAAARDIVQEMETAGINPSLRTYSALVSRAGGYAAARAVVEEMKAAGITPNADTYNTLLSKAEDYVAVCAVVEEMKAAGLSLSRVIYNTLVSKATNYAAALAVVEEMKAAGVNPNIISYHMLVSKAEGWATARALVNEVVATGVIPDEGIYNALMTKAEDYAAAHAALEEMRAAGLSPNKRTYKILVLKATDDATLRALIKELTVLGILSSVFAYNRLVSIAADYATARAVVEEMKAAGINLNAATYMMLARLAADYATARAVVEEMKAAGIRPNVKIYGALLSKAENPAMASAVAKEMEAAGIAPEIGTYNLSTTADD